MSLEIPKPVQDAQRHVELALQAPLSEELRQATILETLRHLYSAGMRTEREARKPVFMDHTRP